MRRFTRIPHHEDCGRTASASNSDNPFRYDGPAFCAASPLVRGDGSRPRRAARFVADAMQRPRRVAALIAQILGTKTERVVLSGSPSGEALRAYFTQRLLAFFPRNRLCRGVLILPQHHEEYLRGRRRQALRTNLKKARIAGIRCETTNDRTVALDVLSDEFNRRDTSSGDRERWGATLARPEVTVMVAYDRRDTPLAISAAVIDDTVCLIELALARSHEARWALHDHLVRTLIARRVRYLLATGGGPLGALAFATNVQHYQRLLGYELRHVIPASPQPKTRRRRPRTSVVAVAATMASIVLPTRGEI